MRGSRVEYENAKDKVREQVPRIINESVDKLQPGLGVSDRQKLTGEILTALQTYKTYLIGCSKEEPLLLPNALRILQELTGTIATLKVGSRITESEAYQINTVIGGIARELSAQEVSVPPFSYIQIPSGTRD